MFDDVIQYSRRELADGSHSLANRSLNSSASEQVPQRRDYSAKRHWFSGSVLLPGHQWQSVEPLDETAEVEGLLILQDVEDLRRDHGANKLFRFLD